VVNTDAHDDQTTAALRECLLFRQACGDKYLHGLAGGLADKVLAWLQAERTCCAHLSPQRPEPLWALFDFPGQIMCRPCLQQASVLLDASGPTCSGCAAPLTHDPDDPHAHVVTVALEPFITGLGEACPDCKSKCRTAKENQA
jgi:hypothetical protein